MSRGVVRGTQLTQPEIDLARIELRAVLDHYPIFGDELLARVRAGLIDGGTYWNTAKECGCIFGWFEELTGRDLSVAKEVAREAVFDLFNNMPYSSQENWSNLPYSRCVENLIADIRPGDKPARKVPLRLIEAWIVEWQAERAANQAQFLAQQQQVAVELYTGDRLPDEVL